MKKQGKIIIAILALLSAVTVFMAGCGTGAAASVCVAHALGLTDTRVGVTTSGGELLGIELKEGSVFLSGAVARVFTGTLDPSLALPGF